MSLKTYVFANNSLKGSGWVGRAWVSHRRGPWRPTGGFRGPRPVSTECARGDDRHTDTHGRSIHYMMIVIIIKIVQ